MEKIDYLRALLEDGKEDESGVPSLSRIARKLKVNRSTVMRGLMTYRAEGILDEKYRFTEKGDAWLRSTNQRVTRLRNWLLALQVEAEKAEADAAAVIQNCSEEGAMVLSNIGVLCSSCGYRNVASGKWFGSSGEEFLQKRKLRFREGQLLFLSFWKERKESSIRELSMANEGFERTGELTERDGAWMLRLRLRTLTHQSAMGQWFSGIARVFEFERGEQNAGDWERAEIREKELLLPLSSFWIAYRGDLSRLRARLHVRISCSVGPLAMPMGSAYLEARMYD